jgi:hypothetical protein
MASVDVWSLLTVEEQELLGHRLIRQAGESVRAACRRIAGGGTAEALQDRATLIRNFIDHAGARDDGPVWREVKSVAGVWLGEDPEYRSGGGVIIMVEERARFLAVLERNGYSVNAWYEIFSRHRHDSAREITETSWETAMHLVNDDAGDPARFFVHWDRRSVVFRKRDRRYWIRAIEQLAAGRSHRLPFPAAEIRAALQRRGLAAA